MDLQASIPSQGSIGSPDCCKRSMLTFLGFCRLALVLALCGLSPRVTVYGVSQKRGQDSLSPSPSLYEAIADRDPEEVAGDWPIVQAAKRSLSWFTLKVSSPFFGKSHWRLYDESHEQTLSGQLVEVADFDGDRKVDLVCIGEGSDLQTSSQPSMDASNGRRSLLPWPFNKWFGKDEKKKDEIIKHNDKYLVIFLWKSKENAFKEGSRSLIPRNITSVIACDWNFDGVVDIIAIGSEYDEKEESTLYSLHAYMHDLNSNTLTEKWNSDASHSSNVHPFIVDINGDGREDIIVQTKVSPNDTNYQRGVWLNSNGGTPFELVSWNSLFDSHFVRDSADVQELQRHVISGSSRGLSKSKEENTKAGEAADLKGVAADGKNKTDDVAKDNSSEGNPSDSEVPIPGTVSPSEMSLHTASLATVLAPRKWPNIAIPHSSSFVDLDGDCRADIVLEVESTKFPGHRELEIWLNDGIHMQVSNEYRNGTPIFRHDTSNIIVLPKGAGQVSYADFDADGTVDIVVPACDRDPNDNSLCNGNSKIYVAFNRQVPPCPSSLFQKNIIDEGCRSMAALCTPSQFKISSLELIKDTSKDDFVSVSPLTANQFSLDFVSSKENSFTVRVGDVDSDGFPDLIILTRNATLPNSQSTVKIFRNIPLSVDSESETKKNENAANTHLRAFAFEENVKFSKTSKDFQISLAAFMDVGEDGILDAIATGKTVQDQRHATVIALNPPAQLTIGDSLFLKATSFNGVQPRAHLSDGKWWSSNRSRQGATSHGPTFKATVTDIWGKKTARAATLLPQSAHHPIGLPFIYLGLGRTNNYIDEFYLGMPTSVKPPLQASKPEISTVMNGRHLEESEESAEGKSEETDDENVSLASPIASSFFQTSAVVNEMFNSHHYSSKWTSIIPNSQILTIPYHLYDPKEWVIELSVSPSHLLLPIFAATTTCLAVIGGLIWFLNRREKAEDNKEHQGFRRHFIAA